MNPWPEEPWMFAWRTERFGIVTLGAFAADKKAADITARFCVTVALAKLTQGG